MAFGISAASFGSSDENLDHDDARLLDAVDLELLAERLQHALFGRDIVGIALQAGDDQQPVEQRHVGGFVEFGQLATD